MPGSLAIIVSGILEVIVPYILAVTMSDILVIIVYITLTKIVSGILLINVSCVMTMIMIYLGNNCVRQLCPGNCGALYLSNDYIMQHDN